MKWKAFLAKILGGLGSWKPAPESFLCYTLGTSTTAVPGRKHSIWSKLLDQMILPIQITVISSQFWLIYPPEEVWILYNIFNWIINWSKNKCTSFKVKSYEEAYWKAYRFFALLLFSCSNPPAPKQPLLTVSPITSGIYTFSYLLNNVIVLSFDSSILDIICWLPVLID